MSLALAQPELARHIVLVLIGNASPGDGFESGVFPAWESLRGQGTTLSQFVANPIGSQSSYALHFGENPERNGNQAGFSFYLTQGPSGWGTPSIPAGKPALPQAMAAQGRATGMFGKLNLGRIDDALDPLTGDRNGFAAYLYGYGTWRAGIGSNVASGPAIPNPGNAYDNWHRWDHAHDSISGEWCDEAIGDEWLAWFATSGQQGPTFSVVSFMASHGPLSGVPPASTLPAGYAPAPGQEAHLMAADHQLGRILAQLDLSQDMVLAFATTGSGAKSVRDDRILCPAVAAGPGFNPGAVHSGLATPRDVWSHMTGEASGPDGQYPLAEYAYCSWQGHKCVRTTDWKLVQLPNGTQQLFNLVQDPEETTPTDPDSHQSGGLVGQLRAWLLNP